VTVHDAFDPRRIVETLDRHHVDYVLVGGYAAQLYGARRPTYDIDITPSTALDNLQRLSRALRELGAGIRVDGLAEGLPFDSTAESLRGMQMLNLRTPLGEVASERWCKSTGRFAASSSAYGLRISGGSPARSCP
jgi:hypothetical protein